MIAYLYGGVASKQDGLAVIEVNGVGYELLVSNQTISLLPSIGEIAKVYTHMIVKEDAISLCGFASLEEKQMFLKLIEVNGVGAKVALSILSGIKLSDLIVAILKDDVQVLGKVKGIGKKTAERLCLELKDKVSPIGFVQYEDQDLSANSNDVEEAIDALISLGLSKQEATRLAKAGSKDAQSAPEIVSNALRMMR